MMRVTAKTLRKALEGITDDALIDVHIPTIHQARGFQASIAIGNARIAFARFERRCFWCSERIPERTADESTRHVCHD